MSVPDVEASSKEAVRRSWRAVAAGTLTVGVAAVLALVGVFSGYELCTGSLGCTEQESEIGRGASAWLTLAGGVLTVGLCWSARVSGRTRGRAVGRGLMAAGAISVAILLVWTVIGARAFAPLLVLGTGVAAAIAVREPMPRVRWARVPAIALLGLLASADDNLGLALLALLAFPAIGVADPVVPPRLTESES